MREVKFINEHGQTLNMDDDSNYALIGLAGTNPPVANINMSTVVNFDGASFIGSTVNQRNVVITLQIRGSVEENRLKLYDIFKVKRKGTLYYRSDLMEAKIDAYVEYVDLNSMTNPVVAMISLICPKPYFEALDSIIANITSVTSLLKFPLELTTSGNELGMLQTNQAVNIINHGDTQIGMIIRFRAIGEVVKPKLLNTKTLEFIELNTTMQAGDLISVNTETGQKRVELDRNSVVTNIFNSLVLGSKFLQLYEGDNILYGTAQSGYASLLVEVEYRIKYIGV